MTAEDYVARVERALEGLEVVGLVMVPPCDACGTVAPTERVGVQCRDETTHGYRALRVCSDCVAYLLAGQVPESDG